MSLERFLVKLGIIEVGQIRSKATQRSNVGLLYDDKISGQSASQPSNKLECVFGFNLHIAQRLTAGQKIINSIDAIVRSQGKVTGLRCRRKSKLQVLTAMRQMTLPGIDMVSEAGIHASLKKV